MTYLCISIVKDNFKMRCIKCAQQEKLFACDVFSKLYYSTCSYLYPIEIGVLLENFTIYCIYFVINRFLKTSLKSVELTFIEEIKS